MPTNIMDKPQLNTVAVSDRRFDSIAWLIQGVDKCGAACFDGDNLLLATNNSQTVKFLNKIVDFLVDYAQACYALRSSLQEHINKIRNYNNSDAEAASEYFANMQRYQDLKKKNKENMFAIESYAYTHIKLYRLNSEYKKAFSDSLKKISRSISHTYFKVNSPKSLGFDFVEAIRNNQIVIQEGSTIHAEMKILESLLHNNKIFGNKKFYIGISKRCCRNCEKVIEAVNNITSLTITEDIDDSSNRIQVRDYGHGIKFSSAIPSFLKNELIPGLKEEFLRLVEEDTLEEAFGVKLKYYDGPSQLHDRSGSEDSTSVESLEIVPFKVPASPARFSDEIMQRLAALERKDKGKSSIEEVASYFIASKRNYVKQGANKNDGKLIRQTPLKEIKQNPEVKVRPNTINANKEFIKMLAKDQGFQSHRSGEMVNKAKNQFNENDSQQHNKIEKKESKQIKPVDSNTVSPVSNPFLFAPRNFPSSEVKEGSKAINVNNEFVKILARNRVTEYNRPSQERLNKEKSRSIGNESPKDKETTKRENKPKAKISAETSVLSPFFASPLPAPKKIPPPKKSNTLPQVLSSKEVPKAVK